MALFSAIRKAPKVWLRSLFAQSRRGLGIPLALAALAVMITALAGYETYLVVRVLSLRRTNPATTAFIEQRAAEMRAQGRTPRRQMIWVPYGRISPNLVRAVIAAEDPSFWRHPGFDRVAMRMALEHDLEKGEFARGGSTITQQLAKNMFLSPSKNPVRKAQELIIALEMERILGKRRILELYLNVIEWGEGIYGAEAAARHYFQKPARSLSPDEAAFLAAIIPSPRRVFDPLKNPQRVQRRANWILGMIQ